MIYIARYQKPDLKSHKKINISIKLSMVSHVQTAIACSKLPIETLEQGVKYVQS